MKGRKFSVLELVVGIVFVVGLLFIGLSVLDSGKDARRDQKRIAHINELRKALDLYRAEEGTFPVVPEAVALSGSDRVSSALEEAGLFRKAPVDPLYPDVAYWYESTADGESYTITFCQETDSNSGYKKGCDNVARP